jgi:hypothetical protein
MPESNSSFWSWLLSLFQRRTPTAVVVPAPTPVITPVPPPAPAAPTPAPVLSVPPSVPPPAPVTLPERAVVTEELREAPALPPAPPTLRPQGGAVPTSLPTEGMNLGFRRIWNNHLTVETGETFPCRDAGGTPNFGNQCAILMGTCLLRSNLLQGYDKPTCWYRGHVGHTLRAREVADWMRRHPERFGPVEVRSNVTWGAFKGRTGFICFQNFWGEGNQGDHIDLWDGTGILMREKIPNWEGPALADGALDYFERSEEVWFWPVH